VRGPAHSGQIERAQFLNSQSHERTDYANGIKPKTALTRAGGLTFDVRQLPGGYLYASALGLQVEISQQPHPTGPPGPQAMHGSDAGI
jgi:hypothetical protein